VCNTGVEGSRRARSRISNASEGDGWTADEYAYPGLMISQTELRSRQKLNPVPWMPSGSLGSFGGAFSDDSCMMMSNLT